MAVLAAATAEAGAGRGGLVMVRADPGLGLSTLLDAHLAAARSAGLRTWRVPVLPSGRTTLSAGVPEWTEPAVVVIDDLHRADDPTLLALHTLADSLPRRALLVVAGRHRGVTPARFAQLDRIALGHDLPPLDRDAVDALVAELFGAGPGSPLRESAEGAGGSPWLLARLTDPDRASAVTGWAAELAGADTGLLRLAALLGPAASVDRLASVSGSPPEEVLAALGRLGALGLVEQDAARARIRYPLLRADLAAASAGLRPSLARRLAGRDAEPEAVVAQLGGAPMDGWTADWLTAHADRLVTRPAPELVDLLRRATAWLPPGDPRHHRIRAALAEALQWSGRLDEARRTAATSLAARPEPPERQRLRGVLARIAVAEMDPDGVFAALEPERVDGRLPPRLGVLHAYACGLAGDLAGAEQGVVDAIPAAAEDPVVEVSMLNLWAVGRCVEYDLAGAMELLDRADAVLDIAVSDPAQWLQSRLMRAVVQHLRFEAAASDTVEEARPVAEALGAGWLAWLHTVAALAAHNDGRLAQGLAEVDAAMALPDQYGMARPLHATAALILLRQGRLPAARARLELAEQHPGTGIAMFYEQVLATTRALLADLEGRPGRALEIVRGVADGAVGVRAALSVMGAGSWLVRIALDGGDHDLARRLVDEVRNRTTDPSVGVRGALMFCQGMVDGDAELLLAASHQFAGIGSEVAAADAGDHAARVLATSGRLEDARAAHRDAISRYTTLAATGDIDRSTAALRSHGVRLGATGSRRRPKHGWAALTGAEYRVAELVAQGLSDREIAARLLVSVRTVHSHVSRALGKLDYSSRIEIVLGFQQRG
ncbi:hypothetical protein GCM10009760_15720 [Kitasatospora kazusensis]|uniref:HTH luxR-type domain-containing protein n=1 Tax=Kitasatospora kazusensis TaxID=407974 RepID=A0ABN2Z3P5_9ACTN